MTDDHAGKGKLRQIGIGRVAFSDSLHRQDQGPIAERDSSLRRGGQQNPIGLFEPAGQVVRTRPGLPIVVRMNHEHLRAFPDFVATIGPSRRPLVVAQFSPHPDGCTKNVSRGAVHHDPGIAAAVPVLWQASVFLHIHDDPHRLPGLSTIGAATETNVDVFLQVATLGPAQIIHAQQRSLGRNRQRRDPGGVHAIVVPLAERETDPFAHAR